MSDSSKPVDADLLLRQRKAEYLRRAEQEFDRDMERFREIAAKYDLPIGLPGAAPASTKPTRAETGKATSAEIIAGAVDFLRRRGTRAQSGEVAKELVSRGLNIGENAGKIVSSYMSRTGKVFDNNPEFGGYGLKEWNGAKGAPGKDG